MVSVLAKPVFVCLLVLTVYRANLIGQEIANERARPKVVLGRYQDRDANIIANGRILKTRVTEHQLYYLLQPDFEILGSGVLTAFLKNDDRIYELLRESAVLDELNLAPEKSKEIQSAALAVGVEWKRFHELYLNNGDIELINIAEKTIEDFSTLLRDTLTSQEKATLGRILARRDLVRIGIPEFLLSAGPNVSLVDRDAAVDRLRAFAADSKEQGNKLMIRQIDKLFPGYLSEMPDNEVTRLPLLPLNCFLAICKAPNSTRGKGNSCLKEFEIRLGEGLWMFPGPVFQLAPAGSEVATALSFQSWRPRPIPFGLIHSISVEELTLSQKSGLRRLRADDSNIYNLMPKNLSRNDRRQWVFKYHESINEWLASELLPAQQRSLQNYLRVHAVFSLGPEFLFDRLKAELEIEQSDFEKDLDEARKEIFDFVDDSNLKLARLLSKEVRNLGGRLEINMSYSPGQPFYEQLINPLLSSPSEVGR